MATNDRVKEPSLVDFLYKEAYRFDFYQAVKLLQILGARVRPDIISLGEAGSPHREALRVKSRSGFAFPASDIHELRSLIPADSGRPIINDLLGSMDLLSASLTSGGEDEPGGHKAVADRLRPVFERVRRFLEDPIEGHIKAPGPAWRQMSLDRLEIITALSPLIEHADSGSHVGDQEKIQIIGLQCRTLLRHLRDLGSFIENLAPPELIANFISLIGLNAPMPVPYSELILDRSYRNDRAAEEFLNLFHHRLAGMMFRVKKHYNIGLDALPPENGEIAQVLYAFLGLATQEARDAVGIPARQLLGYAGLFAWQPHGPGGLEACLRDYFNLPIQVIPAVGQWLALEPDQITHLGRRGQNQELGSRTLLGRRIWNQHSRFMIIVGPLHLADFSNLFPSGIAYAELYSLIRSYAGPELDFELRLQLRGEDVPPLKIGRGQNARLGWTTWLGRANKTATGGRLRTIRLTKAEDPRHSSTRPINDRKQI